MNVCFFGIYDPGYARNRVFAEGFRRMGHTVTHCRVDPRIHTGLRKYSALYREYRKVKDKSFDHVIVCFPGHTVVWLARILFGRRIIFDAFLSLYDSSVWDRKSYSLHSIRAWRDWLYDKISCTLASIILLDTDAHIQYFTKTFGISITKCLRVWIGADDNIFYPRSIPVDTRFTVHFHGTFIPLQGISTIIEAANILKNEDIWFRIVGSGQESSMIKNMVREKLLGRVEFIGTVSIGVVSDYMASAQVVLGIFGTTEKTQRVIPNKVYEAMAMGKAIVTADTPALRELMPNVQEVVTVPVGDAKSLANAIRVLKTDPARCVQLGKDARALFEAQLLPEKIVADLLGAIAAH